MIANKTRRRRRLADVSMKCENGDNVPNKDNVETEVTFECNSEGTYTEDTLSDNSEVTVSKVAGEDPEEYLSSVNMNELPDEITGVLSSLSSEKSDKAAFACGATGEVLNFTIGNVKEKSSEDITFPLTLTVPSGKANCIVYKESTNISCGFNVSEFNVNVTSETKITYEDQTVAVSGADKQIEIKGNTLTSTVECPVFSPSANLTGISKVEFITLTGIKKDNNKIKLGQKVFLIETLKTTLPPISGKYSSRW